MVELEVRRVLFLINGQTKSNYNLFISLQAMDFQGNIICWMFLYYSWKGNSQNKDDFFQKTMNFESGF